MYKRQGDSSHGGEINLIAGKIDGDSDAAISGGAISLTTGYSKQSSSGQLSLRTINSGTNGVSGTVTVQTGTASTGLSGTISLLTGSSKIEGGGVYISVGDTNKANGIGGPISLKAGDTLDAQSTTGGYIKLKSGASKKTTSGFIRLITPNSGTGGESGKIDLVSGTSTLGNSGSLSLIHI